MTIVENHKHTFQVDDLGQWDLDEDRSIVPSIQNALKYEGIDAIEVRMNRTYNTLLKYKLQMNFPMDKVNHRWQAYEKDIKKWEEFQLIFHFF